MESVFLPPTAENVACSVDSILSRHPCAKSFCVGKSVLGRKIIALSLGDPHGGVLYVGATHGSEWLTASLLLEFFDELCYAYEHNTLPHGIDVCRAILTRGVLVVPVLNPDGVEIALRGPEGALSLCDKVQRLSGGKYIHWNANAHGVDINHNFGAGWGELRVLEQKQGIFGPSPGKYGGPAPFSEPETRAACGICSTFGVKRLYSFHSQGEEIYWRYGSNTPAASQEIAKLLAEASGYRLSDPTGTACCGGFKDWFIQRFSLPGFTIEIGRGTNPLPTEDLAAIRRTIFGMLFLSLTI